MPGFVARYRYVVIVKPDDDTDRAVSEPHELRVDR